MKMMQPALNRNIPALALLAGVLSACASQNQGISTMGGDAFMLDVASINGTRAVEQGLAQAQSFCSEHGRLFVMTDSLVGSSSYRLAFRCIAPGNVLPPPPLVASAAPAPAARTPRGRRARNTPAPVADAVSSGPALGHAATLPPMMAPMMGMPMMGTPMMMVPTIAGPMMAPGLRGPAFTTAWSPGTANIPQALPPVAATALFAPQPGTMLAVQPLTGPRLPPADNSPLVALPRLESMAVPEARPASVMALQPAMTAPRGALPPVGTLPIMQMAPTAQPVVQAQPLPVVQAQPLPPIQFSPASAPAAPLSTPPPSFGGPGFGGPGFGAVVPSPTPLPGATSSLPPIAGGSRAVPLPGGNASGFSGSGSGFSQGFR